MLAHFNLLFFCALNKKLKFLHFESNITNYFSYCLNVTQSYYNIFSLYFLFWPWLLEYYLYLFFYKIIRYTIMFLKLIRIMLMKKKIDYIVIPNYEN
jgi:hypothetical protein